MFSLNISSCIHSYETSYELIGLVSRPEGLASLPRVLSTALRRSRPCAWSLIVQSKYDQRFSIGFKPRLCDDHSSGFSLMPYVLTRGIRSVFRVVLQLKCVVSSKQALSRRFQMFSKYSFVLFRLRYPVN